MTAVLTRTLRWGAILAAVLLVAGGVLGWLVASERGLVSALLGTTTAVVFMGMTAASLLIANRSTSGRPSLVAFAGIIVGTFLGKMIVFVVLMIWLRTQSWLEPGVFGIAAVVAVIGTLAIDIAAMATTRVPIVDVPERPADAHGD